MFKAKMLYLDGREPIFRNSSRRSAEEQLTYKLDHCEWCNHIWEDGDYVNEMHRIVISERIIWWILKTKEQRMDQSVACDWCKNLLVDGGEWQHETRVEIRPMGPPSPF